LTGAHGTEVGALKLVKKLFERKKQVDTRDEVHEYAKLLEGTSITSNTRWKSKKSRALRISLTEDPDTAIQITDGDTTNGTKEV
jgi:hypothetical protein